MLRKALTFGMVFIFALSLLAVSMVTCFTYDAEAHLQFWCVPIGGGPGFVADAPVDGHICTIMEHHETG